MSVQLLARGGATVSGVGQEDNLILRPPEMPASSYSTL